jgi:hypothetical protein
MCGFTDKRHCGDSRWSRCRLYPSCPWRGVALEFAELPGVLFQGEVFTMDPICSYW